VGWGAGWAQTAELIQPAIHSKHDVCQIFPKFHSKKNSFLSPKKAHEKSREKNTNNSYYPK
jgi:hypothetical protein